MDLRIMTMLIYTLPDGRQLTQGQAFELNGKKFSRAWLAKATPEMLAAHGITVEEVPPPEPEPPTVQDLLDYLGRKRVEVEEGGIVFNGITVATDREHSQVKLTAAYIKAINDPSFKITNSKNAPGVFIPEIDANTIIAMGDAVTNHIQTCFDKEADLTQKI